MSLEIRADEIQSQTRNSPVIVGEQYELAESVGSGYVGEALGGLLAKPNGQAALLSMSGSAKSPNADLNDFNARRPPQSYATLAEYNASRPTQGPMYLTYALPGLADPDLQPPATAYDRHADQMAYSSAIDQPRAPYEATSSAYSDFEARKLPEVSTYNPQHGTKGSDICIYIDSQSDLLSPTPLIAGLMFATHRVPATLTRLETREHDACYKYVATANAPSFAETGSPNARVSIKLQLQEDSGMEVGLLDVGPWLYEDCKRSDPLPTREAIRKRKMKEEFPGMPISMKRGTPPADESEQYDSYGYASSTAMAYPQSLRSIDLSTMQRKLTPYGRSQAQQDYQEDPVPNFSGGVGPSHSLMRPPTSQNPAWSPYTMGYQAAGSPVVSNQSYQTTSPSSNTANPRLLRTSQIQTPSGTGSTSGASSDGSFNPYALYNNKAIIKIRGDLNTMQDSWSAEERTAKRRLVLFRGDQSGSTINTYFRASRPEERPSTQGNRERRISCIYWEEREEYFVTSVDTIALLETLVGARFTVEEKNRIRRNLETHHPLTVSKGKPDTENFFKVIMGFPHPKPRNIEKDVKVFPWPILAQALRKVISKYSASHASTAGPLPNSRPANPARSPSEQNNEPYLSPGSSTSSSYTQTLKSGTLSPTTAPSHGLPSYSQPSPLHTYTVPVPTLASQYPHHEAAKPLTSPYTTQDPMPELSHAYTSSGIGRRRFSEANTGTQSYTTRPCVNTSFTSPYSATQDPTDYSTLTTLPPASQPLRAAWNFSPYLHPASSSDSDYNRRQPSANQGAAVAASQYTYPEEAEPMVAAAPHATIIASSNAPMT